MKQSGLQEVVTKPGDSTVGRHASPLDDLFLGSVTVGERGQIVVPAEARKHYGIEPGERLLVMASPDRKGLLLCRMHDLRDYILTFPDTPPVASADK